MHDLEPLVFGNQWVFCVAIALLLLGVSETGYRIGLRLFAARDEARRSQIGGIQGAILGLLGLLLGFTFSMAVTRFETRRDFVLREANVIGTTWLRADLLPEAHRTAAKALLKRFVDVRVEYQRVTDDAARLAEGLRVCAEIENALWQQALEAVREAPTPITAMFINSLNEMIDTDPARETAGRNEIPSAVWLLLLIVAGAGCFTTAYGSGAAGARSAFTAAILPLLITVVIVLIFDLMHPHQGIVSIDQKPMLDLQQRIGAQAGAS
ncbi:MAG: hypothetical protein U0900_15205 [Myxococcota bacterium]